MNPEPSGGVSRPEKIDVRLLVWGVTEADQERAIDRASRGRWRNTWEFVQTDRLTGKVCPLNLRDGKSIATDEGYGWAYLVYLVWCP